ncbi:MAG TPA: bifunctional 2',3'-cyclic-nucleotide 2'-phosphodiesterase/3'-nucleotidase, partial [Rudaea sp.]|uniref:bifunctional 2',3'-cyclic-nucleotide 2'-phosphodiesterase/3'-nucleotidase n=1 Tax=Rudaea sp. TaxID=2136325 RepID=UPI002F9261EB
ASLVLVACAMQRPDHQAAPAAGTRTRIGILETTDIHSNIMSYDYFKLAEDRNLGFERAAELIRTARKEFENSLTFDAGDTIQGTALADWQAQVKPLPCDQELAIYKAMDAVGYDAGTIGNHEFNYGLPFLSQVTGTAFNITGVPVEKCKGPHFPLVLSNVFSVKDGKPLYAPWRVLTRTFHANAADGSARDVTLRIGLLGFTPTGIMEWDKRNLDGKVTVMGVVEAAQKYLPELHKAGVDLVIAIVHGGIDTSPYSAKTENAGWHLAGVPGIDAILLGHSHQIFPSPGDAKARYAHLPEVDNERGFIRGVPAVMGNYYGKNIGLIDLSLVYQDGRWQIDRAATHAEVRSVKNADGSYVDVDAAIAPLVKPEHEGTIAYVKTPIGSSDFEMSTYFVAAGDTSALQIVDTAEREYVEKYIKANLPQFADVPVLAAASPFKAGFGGPLDYTDVKAGRLAIANAADLYLYPNTVTAVKIDGAGIKAWLEKSASWFQRIDPTKSEAQELINTRVPTYTFDVIQGGLTYAIDVTQPVGQRIGDLRYRDRPLSDAQPFIVVTNNYRASGGEHFPGLDGSNIVISAPDANRDVLIAAIRDAREITRARFGNDHNWHFAHVKTAGPVVFTSAAGKLDLARAAGLENVTLWKDNGDGSAVYSLDLSR